MKPAIYPQVTTEMSELKLKDQGYYMGYSSSNQAGTFNVVAMSALQVFISMIPPELVSTEIYTIFMRVRILECWVR
jgi:hypothetical protein